MPTGHATTPPDVTRLLAALSDAVDAAQTALRVVCAHEDRWPLNDAQAHAAAELTGRLNTYTRTLHRTFNHFEETP